MRIVIGDGKKVIALLKAERTHRKKSINE